jgi:ribosome-associated heat shock protein Hsp15
LNAKPGTRVRLDKWLWAARFFKTRSLAAQACDLGRIQSNGHPAKPSREVHAGDRLAIKTASGEYVVEVLLVSAIRGPAAVAQTLYQETEASKDARLKAGGERKASGEFVNLPEGRPSKRDRRKLDQFRGR